MLKSVLVVGLLILFLMLRGVVGAAVNVVIVLKRGCMILIDPESEWVYDMPYDDDSDFEEYGLY